jgi:hypothetical protein
MSDRTSLSVTANLEALLSQALHLLLECRETLTTMEPGRLEAYSIQLEDAAESLQSAALSLPSTRIEAPARERCLLLARTLHHQVSQFDALLNGWAGYLGAWHQIRECHEHGYTAAGAPSPAPANLHARGEI